MKFGLCAWSFSSACGEAGTDINPLTPAGLVATATTRGLEAVELASRWFDDFSRADLTEFASEVSRKGLSVIVDTGGEAPGEVGSAVQAALGTAEVLGASVVRTTISRCLEGDRGRYGYEGWKEHLRSLVAPLKEAAARAGEVGIAVGVENHQDICSRELLWLCEQVGSAYFGVVMDCGNALAVGEHPAAFAERVMPFLKHVHLKDYKAYPSPSGWRLVRCPLGDGVVDFPDLLPRFEVGAPGTIGCVELGAPAARHVKLLKEEWWLTFDPRPWQESLAAIRELHAGQQPATADWRTPHERGAPAATVAAYEIDQLDASVTYLRKL